RGLKCDNSIIKGLLLWTWERELIPSINVAFEVATWDDIGKALWDTISAGGDKTKEASKYATHWKVVRDVLQAMRVERQTAAAVCMAVIPSDASMSAASAYPAAVRGTFSTQLSLPPRASISASAETSVQTQPLPIPSQVAGAESIPLPVTPRETGELGAAACRPIDSEVTDLEVVNQLQELTVRSKEPEVRRCSSSQPEGPSRKGEPRRQESEDFGRMLVSLSLPPPHFNPSRLSEPKMVEPSAPAIDAEPPATAAADERERHWRGVIKNALVEGTMIQAFPVVIQNNGLKRWEAFDWKVLEKLKTTVSQY
ncbi:uncharacterized protein LOC115337553, partial [Aquila chrysaetos chrysaetos]|uniref:uncharacterized protein LOC115337553 n=1 Tax=Aquila chrysaetos chrysaetos TaxID=223781 RepID=UPI001B7D4145